MPFRIDLNVDPALLLERMRNGEKRLAYAVVNAINNTARAVQVAEVASAQHAFKAIRKPEFLLGREGRGGQIAIIKPFASVGRGVPYAEISIGQKPRLLLPLFEEGGARPAFKGRSVAVPVIGGPARPSFEQPVPASMRFTALRLRLTPRREGAKRRKKKGDAEQAQVRYGLQDTYQVPGVGVFQRKPGEGARIVYAFVEHEQVGRRLSWMDVARRTAATLFPVELKEQIELTLIRHGLTRGSLS